MKPYDASSLVVHSQQSIASMFVKTSPRNASAGNPHFPARRFSGIYIPDFTLRCACTDAASPIDTTFTDHKDLKTQIPAGLHPFLSPLVYTTHDDPNRLTGIVQPLAASNTPRKARIQHSSHRQNSRVPLNEITAAKELIIG